ncbi:TPA: hypothetical protein ACHUB4_004743 [Escherichia coli]
MAWTANGTGGIVELSGTLTPKGKTTPWEIQVGGAVTGLDAQIVRGEKTVVINVDKAIPFLGIRTIDKTAFKGQAGIALQISYGDALKIDAFNEGYAPLILEVKDANGVKIGTMETRILVAAMASVKLEDEAAEEESLYATASGQGFLGGLVKGLML